MIITSHSLLRSCVFFLLCTYRLGFVFVFELIKMNVNDGGPPCVQCRAQIYTYTNHRRRRQTYSCDGDPAVTSVDDHLHSPPPLCCVSSRLGDYVLSFSCFFSFYILIHILPLTPVPLQNP